MSLLQSAVFRQRAITAIVFVAVMLVGLFWNEISFLVVFGIITLGSLWEFWGVTLEKTRLTTLKKIIGLVFGLAIYYTFYTIFTPSQEYIVRGWFQYVIGRQFFSGLAATTLFTIALFFILIIVELFDKSQKSFQNVSYLIAGMFYIAFPFALLHQLVGLSGSGFDPKIVFGILWLVWSNDTGAYIIGSRMGKTPLAPHISPKKTWEGTLGGVFTCIIMGVTLNYLFKGAYHINWSIVAVIVAVFGTLGDLVESMLKRSVGVKDSGSFMPGHGGFLDRFDAFLFSIPFVALYVTIISQ